MRALIMDLILICVAVTALITQSEANIPIFETHYYPVGTVYKIEFSVHNTLNEFIWGFKVRDVMALDVAGPSGWNIYRQSYIHYAVEWTTRVAERYLWPGESLSGFAFTVETVRSSYVCYVATRSSGRNVTIAPVLVPEPASLFILTAGLAGMGGVTRRRR